MQQPVTRLFQSFWQGGFESACHRNSTGTRIDMIAATQHDTHALEDYLRVQDFGIHTVRDGVRWHLIDQGGTYDFSSLAPLARAAQKTGMQVIWTLCHYGWPNDIDLFSTEFVDRFAAYAKTVARYLGDITPGPHFYSPINEISFVSYAIGTQNYMYPYATGRAADVKRQLVRATIAAEDAIWEVEPGARMVHVDPLCHVVHPRGQPELAEAAAGQRASQHEAADMIAGRCEPQLGGAAKYLDIVGVNFYHSNQWEYPDVRMRWEDSPRDDRWIPLHLLLEAAYAYYERPLLIAETSHFGCGRARWMREIAEEVALARVRGVPLEGVCLYPILDRPDWENPNHWHNSGLWDLHRNGDDELQRVLCEEYACELRRCHELILPADRLDRSA